jgi:hypothetical protein
LDVAIRTVETISHLLHIIQGSSQPSRITETEGFPKGRGSMSGAIRKDRRPAVHFDRGISPIAHCFKHVPSPSGRGIYRSTPHSHQHPCRLSGRWTMLRSFGAVRKVVSASRLAAFAPSSSSPSARLRFLLNWLITVARKPEERHCAAPVSWMSAVPIRPVSLSLNEPDPDGGVSTL